MHRDFGRSSIYLKNYKLLLTPYITASEEVCNFLLNDLIPTSPYVASELSTLPDRASTMSEEAFSPNVTYSDVCVVRPKIHIFL